MIFIQEVGAMLKPLYDALEKHYYNGEMEKSMDYIHTDAVVVNKGNGAQYGKQRKLVVKIPPDNTILFVLLNVLVSFIQPSNAFFHQEFL